MAQFENAEQAAAALAEAVSAPDTPAQSEFAAGAPTSDPNQLVAEPGTTQGVPGDQGVPAEPAVAAPEPAPEFTPSKDIDLSGLNEEQLAFVQAREKEMQAAFTQKTQELAQARQEAEQAIQFVNELNTNPYFAQQVVGELSQQLQAAGYSQAQADQMAVGQVQQAQQGQPNAPAPNYDELGFEEDPYLQGIQRNQQELDQIKGYLAQQQETQRVASIEAQLNNMIAYVQSQNPDFTEADMSKVVNMAYAYNGDIPRAAEDYKSIREAAVQGWIARKESVSAPSPVGHTGSAVAAPEKFDGLNDPRLEAAAIRRLNEALGT